MIRVGIIGATGYTGAELVRLLIGHPRVTITWATSRQFAGTRFDRVYPALAGLTDLVCEAYDPDEAARRADLIFTALPHQKAMEYIPDLVARGLKVVDLSADFRFADPDAYAAAYEPHRAPELARSAVYGLAEIYAEAIAAATLVGNPGCYPTSVLLPLVPLLNTGWIALDGMIADAKSGVSGAGRSPSLGVHFCEVNESFKAYKVATHRHAPEMAQILSRESGRPIQLTFVPHLVPMSRGMQTTIYTALTAAVTADRIRDRFAAVYGEKPFIRICPDGTVPDTRHVRGTNYCDIGFVIDRDNHRLILLSAIDNLVKGAAGQAIQNMNLMMGFAETDGLQIIPGAM